MFSSFLKADFVTLTCVAIGLLFVHDASNLERSTFRKLVGLVFFSLVYDLVWFSIYNEDLENKLDGEIQTGLRKFSLLINYFSFLFRILLLLILWKDSIDFVQLIKEQKEESTTSLELIKSPGRKAT